MSDVHRTRIWVKLYHKKDSAPITTMSFLAYDLEAAIDFFLYIFVLEELNPGYTKLGHGVWQISLKNHHFILYDPTTAHGLSEKLKGFLKTLPGAAETF